MKTFGSFLYENFIKENIDEIGSEFDEILKQAQAAYDDEDYDKAFEIINTSETNSAAEESLKSHFLSMLTDKRSEFSQRLGEPY